MLFHAARLRLHRGSVPAAPLRQYSDADGTMDAGDPEPRCLLNVVVEHVLVDGGENLALREAVRPTPGAHQAAEANPAVASHFQFWGPLVRVAAEGDESARDP